MAQEARVLPAGVLDPQLLLEERDLGVRAVELRQEVFLSMAARGRAAPGEGPRRRNPERWRGAGPLRTCLGQPVGSEVVPLPIILKLRENRLRSRREEHHDINTDNRLRRPVRPPERGAEMRWLSSGRTGFARAGLDPWANSPSGSSRHGACGLILSTRRTRPARTIAHSPPHCEAFVLAKPRHCTTMRVKTSIVIGP